jgi:hypothetical protein
VTDHPPVLPAIRSTKQTAPDGIEPSDSKRHCWNLLLRGCLSFDAYVASAVGADEI